MSNSSWFNGRFESDISGLYQKWVISTRLDIDYILR
jgi:hypothetical protein